MGSQITAIPPSASCPSSQPRIRRSTHSPCCFPSGWCLQCLWRFLQWCQYHGSESLLFPPWKVASPCPQWLPLFTWSGPLQLSWLLAAPPAAPPLQPSQLLTALPCCPPPLGLHLRCYPRSLAIACHIRVPPLVAVEMDTTTQHFMFMQQHPNFIECCSPYIVLEVCTVSPDWLN